MDIHYKVEFFSDWHCGSGLAAGADVDMLVIKDKDGLPFIPGKTIKGLLREAVTFINEKTIEVNKDDINATFGYFGNKDDKQKGATFFKNAELSPSVKKGIIENDTAKFLYREISSTAINDKGIAKEHSLREMQVTIPCELEGEILDVPNSMVNLIGEGLSYIKRLGQGRNRGLGRCEFTVIK
jgi:CRISPR/Cas system CSM-associated protein Csm3 (group 7 of RAMP superfamily)